MHNEFWTEKSIGSAPGPRERAGSELILVQFFVVFTPTMRVVLRHDYLARPCADFVMRNILLIKIDSDL
jgi:hypothetical protein